MKKLYLLAAAGMTALTMNANLYLVGNGAGMTWDLPGTEIAPNADGSYTLNLSACDQFKVSKVNSTAWDGDGGYNSGAFAPKNADHSFTNAVFNTGGETVATEAWGENISLPANGRYTITINADCSQMTAVANFARPTAAPDVYLRGGMNSWGSSDAYKFTNVNYDANTGNGEWTWTGTITAGVEFKIADSTWGNINYTTTDQIVWDKPINMLYNNTANMKLSKDFNGTITFKITGSKTATCVFTVKSEGPVYPDNLFIIGTIGGNAWDPANVAAMTNAGEGIYTITGLKLAENAGSCGFSITGGGTTWDEVNALRFGPAISDTPATIGSNPVDGMGDVSWSISAGTYNMTFNYTERTLLIENAGGGDTPVTPTPDPTGYVYVVGNGTGMTWDLPGQEFPVVNGVATLNLKGVQSFKVSVNKSTVWDGDGGYNAGAYSTGMVTFDESVGNAGGQTLAIEPWGENQLLPWTGDYTVTVNFNDMTMNAYTTTAQPTGPADVYIRGEFTGENWAVNDLWKMTYDESKEAYTFTCAGETMIHANEKFKFADSNWGSINLGNGNLFIEVTKEGVEEVLQTGGQDMAMADDFTGTITLKLDSTGAVATFVSDGKSGVNGFEAAEGEAVYYNLQGHRVLNPDKGIFIRVIDGKAVKVVK